MNRDIRRLSDQRFDLLVVGAGIHGACIAREAALAGLTVALIDKADLGGATSHNSLKILHGGVRYLQHLNFKRTLEGIIEQAGFRRSLSAHTRHVTFLMPTYGHGMRGPIAMWCGLFLYNILTAITSLCIRQPLPRQWATVVSASKARQLTGNNDKQITGAALWHELQVENADRALLDIVQQAASHGACVASYVSADKLLVDGHQVTGVRASDQLDFKNFDIAAATTVDATGPWAGRLAKSIHSTNGPSLPVPMSKSMNLLIDKSAGDFALALKSSQASDSVVGQTQRLFFTIPWKGATLVGTSHSARLASPGELSFEESDTAEFIDEINHSFPNLQLSEADILYCYQGLTPLDEPGLNQNRVLHHSLIIDYSKETQMRGLFSVVGVKWTTARAVAQRCLRLVLRQQKLMHINSIDKARNTLTLPIPPTGLPSLSTMDDRAIEQFCVNQIRSSMTMTLSDMLLRRMDDFILGKLDEHRFSVLARTMADELGWDVVRCRSEHQRLLSNALPSHRRISLTNLNWWQ